MPKALSLKKAHHSQPLTNQKSITQFFKNASSGPSQSVPKHGDETQNTGSKLDSSSCNKRKASSPVQVDLESDMVPERLPKNNKSPVNTINHKKPKVEKDTKQLIAKTVNQSESFNSPEKENSSDKDQKIRSQPFMFTNRINLIKDISDSKTIRCPLSPVKFEKDHKAEVLHKSREKEVQHNVYVSISAEKLTLKTPDDSQISLSPKMKNGTPKKSPLPEIRRSPRIMKLLTPEKLVKSSPVKNAIVKALDFDNQKNAEEAFDDDWELNDMEEELKEDLDLSVMQRCEVLSILKHPVTVELKLRNATNNRGTCFVEGCWLDTPLCPGEIISVLASPGSSGKFSVNNSSGLLVLRPDHLLSATSVVAGVFCKRKAVLQERWRGIDSANTAMTMGILIHELVQKTLMQNITDIKCINAEVDRIIKESLQTLYDAGLTEAEVRMNMQVYIPPLAEFMQTYVGKNPPTSANNQKQKGKWNGHVKKVLDIEENLCCPQLGLKGKIDATLEVTIHDRKGNKSAIVPLELKSGKASVSAEHRGQLVLYGMMLALQRGEDPARAHQRGLLLYLKERVELLEVSCGYPERRDLVLLRNQLVQDLAAAPTDPDPEQITDIEDASILLQQRLPEPIHRENVCAKCPYLTICSLHLWHTDGPSVTESHPLSKLQGSALGHLSPAHIQYFLHWTALLKAEERLQFKTSPLHALWTDCVEEREKRGTCAANLHLQSVEVSGDRFHHIFKRQITGSNSSVNVNQKGPQEGEFSIVSIENRPWIAAGAVIRSTAKEMHMLLERDLSRRLGKSTKFHIDTYESYATTVQNLTNLGVLMEDSERAERLRSVIIDKETPEFEVKLPREVGRVGSKLMRRLNIEQQRGVLRALAARRYALLQGLPGTGKTQTISVLIQMLVALKLRVLVTAHTHSAVDNVLARLPESTRVMRLGPAARVAARVAARCEPALAATCENLEQLDKLYDSMEVVGVTCLGAAHAMLARTTFDMCIVDEATQVPQCTVLRPLFAAKRFVLVGDPEQLPPVVRSKAARRLGMEESLFHRLMSSEATSTLQLQYRMNAPLAALANNIAYQQRLKCANNTVAEARLDIDMEKISDLVSRSSWLSMACSPATEYAALFLDVQSETVEESKSLTNRGEACVALALVDAFIQGGVKPSDIGVIAPYRDQVSLLKRALSGRGVEASTVDQFQGRDKSAIVFSCTRRPSGQDDRKVKEGEVLNDQRRLAVSVTRAKHKLVVIGDSRALRRYEPLDRLISACETVLLPEKMLAQELGRYKDCVL